LWSHLFPTPCVMASKRKLDEDAVAGAGMKRARPSTAIVAHSAADGGAIVAVEEKPRTSKLAAPIMQLSGHEGALYSCAFDPSGQHLASAGKDRLICEWRLWCPRVVVRCLEVSVCGWAPQESTDPLHLSFQSCGTCMGRRQTTASCVGIRTRFWTSIGTQQGRGCSLQALTRRCLSGMQR
jgi:hypothetical protein